MIVTSGLWLVSLIGISVTFLAEFVIVDRDKKGFTTKQATAWVLFYIVAAGLFGAYVWQTFGDIYGQQFFAGWLTEYSLSVDNIFVFIVLLTSFQVPDRYKHEVLLIGVIIALVLRAILIAVGITVIHRFTFAFYFFSAFLLFTAYKVWRSEDVEPDPKGNSFVRFVERRLTSRKPASDSVSTGFSSTSFVLVILAVGTTDVLFALDSIPAVLGLTNEAYLIVMVNAFALLGLRQLYFLLSGLMDKIVYLPKALSAILGFIAVKLFLEALHTVHKVDVPEITTHESFAVILGVLGIAIAASLFQSQRKSAGGEISAKPPTQQEEPPERL